MDAVIDKAIATLGSSEKAYSWLLTPNRVLDGLTPFSLMNTLEGREVISAILTRIEYGVYS